MKSLIIGNVTHIFLNDGQAVRDAIEPPAHDRPPIHALCTICEHRYQEHAIARAEIVTEPGIIANCRCCARTRVVPVKVELLVWLIERRITSFFTT